MPTLQLHDHLDGLTGLWGVRAAATLRGDRRHEDMSGRVSYGPYYGTRGRSRVARNIGSRGRTDHLDGLTLCGSSAGGGDEAAPYRRICSICGEPPRSQSERTGIHRMPVSQEMSRRVAGPRWTSTGVFGQRGRLDMTTATSS